MKATDNRKVKAIARNGCFDFPYPFPIKPIIQYG